MRDVVGARVVGDRIRDILARQRHGLRAQALRQPQRLGDPVALRLAHAQVAPGLDMHRGPRRLQTVRHALGVTHHVDAARIAADAGQHALAGRPGPRDRVGLHVADHLLVDPLRRAAQREFAQRGQVAGREVVADGALGLVRHIDLAVLQALDQVVRRQVDQLDVVGLVDDRIRHGLAHADAGDLRDDVVQAFDVLDVERGVDVDAGGDQLLDIHVALGMAAARRVGVRQLIDQRELRAARQEGVEIHLLQRAPVVLDAPARDDLQAVEQCLGFLAPVRLDHADDDIDAFLHARAGGGEHLVGLADARRRAEEDLQAAARALLRRLQQRVG